MGQQRTDFQTILEAVLGTPNVYFQPPDNVEMQYPCIVYKRDNASTDFAGNLPYLIVPRYEVTYMSRTPDGSVRGKLAKLPMSLFNRYFSADGLHHDVFLIYFGG